MCKSASVTEKKSSDSKGGNIYFIFLSCVYHIKRSYFYNLIHKTRVSFGFVKINPDHPII
jgi:hypothetical protein